MAQFGQGYIHIRDIVTLKRKSGAKQFPEKTQQRNCKALNSEGKRRKSIAQKRFVKAKHGLDKQRQSIVRQRHSVGERSKGTAQRSMKAMKMNSKGEVSKSNGEDLTRYAKARQIGEEVRRW